MPDNNNNDGGFLKSAAIATPLAVGAGVSIRNMMRNTTLVSNPSAIESMQRAATRITEKPIDIQSHLNFMNQQFAGNKGGDIAKSAWQAAMTSVDPITRRQLRDFTGAIAEMSDEEAISAIRNTMENNQSMLMKSIYKRFARNVNKLATQRTRFPQIPITFADVAAEQAPIMRRAMPKGLQKRFARIEAALGVNVFQDFYSTPQLFSQGLGVFDVTLAGAPGGDISFKLPLTSKGRLVEGMTMQTERIAPNIKIVSGKKVVDTMSREEFFLEEFEKSIVPDIKSGRLKTRGQINRAVSQLRNAVFGKLEAFATLEERQFNVAKNLRTMLRGQQVQLLTPSQRVTEGKTGFVSGYKAVTGQTLSDVLVASQGTDVPLYGGTSGTAISKGIVSTEDISQMFTTPEAIDWGRNPQQSFREYQLTADAANKLKQIQGDRFFRFQELQSDLYRKTLDTLNQGQSINPSLQAMFIDPEAQESLIRELRMGEGHAVMRRDIAEALEFQTTQPLSLKQVRSDLAEQIGKGGFVAQKGDVLGVDEGGNIVRAQKDMEILRMYTRESEAKGNYAVLEYLDRHRTRHGDKFFGGDRATMLVKDQEIIAEQFRIAGLKTVSTPDTEVIMRADALKKNRQLFRLQVTSALQENMGMGVGRTPVALSSQWSAAAGLDDVSFIRQAMKFGLEEARLTPEQFGTTFGMAPGVLGKDVTQQLIQETAEAAGRDPEALWATTRQGIARGMTFMAFDSPAALKGAGSALGSLESRIFETLRDPQWGTLGQDISEELTERMMYTNPDKYRVYTELGKTIESIQGERTPSAGANIFEAERYKAGRFQQWIENLSDEGGWIRQGKGMKDVYVPSPSVVNKMRPFQTAAGEQTRGLLAQTYHDIARNASQMYSQVDPLSMDEVRRNMQGFTDQLAYHWAPGGKGMGGFLRGKVEGSEFLRPMLESSTGEIMDDLQTVGITKGKFRQLAGQLEDQYGAAFTEDMVSRFEAGERVGGLVARHPFIGPYSMQQVMFRQIEGEADQIIMPEITQRLSFRGGGGASIKLGPTVGMAQDFDADLVAAYLVSPKNEAAIRANLNNTRNTYSTSYMQHQLRYQLLKAGKASDAAEGLTIAEKMAADVRKLGVAESYVPKLSTEMSRARAALGAFGTGQAAEDAKMLLEWLEQTPISGKHLGAKQVSEGFVEETMDRITASLENRSARSLRSVIGDITRGDPTSQQLLTGDINLRQQLTPESFANLQRNIGGDLPDTLRGANVDAAINELMRTSAEAQETGFTRAGQVLTGRASRVKPDEIMSAIRNTKVGGMAGVSRMSTAVSNMLGALGRGIIRNKKPIGFGFAGALAISAMLSSPKDTIGPGNRLNVGMRPKMSPGKAADKMTPENIMPPSPQVGQPAAPNMLSAQQVRIGSSEPSQRMNVRARIGSMTNTANLSSRISNMTNRSTSINIRDNRENMSPHRIANKLL